MTQNLRKLLFELSIPLLLVAVMDVGFAQWVDHTPGVPLPKLLGSSIFTGKYLAFLRAVRGGDSVDIVYTGLSPMMLLDASAIDAALARGGRDSRGFNFAAPMEGLYSMTPLLARIVDPLTAPTLVVHGLMPLDVMVEPRRNEATERLLQLPVFSFHVGGLRARLRELMTTRLSLIEYREVIVDWFWRHGPPEQDFWIEFARATDPWGKIPRPERPPPTGLQEYERVYRDNLRQFRKSMEETPVFERTIAFSGWCKSRGIDLVLVNTPVHPLFFELLPRGRADYALFVERLHGTAEAAGVFIFDPLGDAPGPPAFFGDTHHLNSEGAKWLSKGLAAYLLDHGLPRAR